MLTLLFQKVASHTVYFLCSQKRRRNTKQGWQINKSRFTLLFTIGMGWQSAGKGGGGLGPNADVADGTGENSPRRSSLVEAADWCETQQHSKKARRESGSNEDLGNPKVLQSSECIRDGPTSPQNWRDSHRPPEMQVYGSKETTPSRLISWSLKLRPIAKQLLTTQWDNGWCDLTQQGSSARGFLLSDRGEKIDEPTV